MKVWRTLVLVAIAGLAAGNIAWAQTPQKEPIKVIQKVDPVYPDEAERAGVEGKVVVDVTIEKSGEVSLVKVISGPKLLQQAAVDAVKQWRFSNTLNDSVTIQVTLVFNLNSDNNVPAPAITATHKVNAIYPDSAKRDGIKGEVPVEITVNEKGDVIDARAVGGNERLRQAAVDAAKQFKFSNSSGKNIVATITFNFVLD